MKSIPIPNSSLSFLTSLSKNNNREWFNAHKDTYLEAHQQMLEFVSALADKMNTHDHLVEEAAHKYLYRIYADVRFSKDKKPYKTSWSGRFKRASKKLRGGYYFHIEPGNSYVAGGFFGPNPEDLKRIREDIDMNYEEWNKLLSHKSFIKTFNALEGEKVTTAPKGYLKDHPAIDLLRYKQFIIRHRFTDTEVLSKDFITQVNNTFKHMRPFFNHMSEILTTDGNGVSVI